MLDREVSIIVLPIRRGLQREIQMNQVFFKRSPMNWHLSISFSSDMQAYCRFILQSTTFHLFLKKGEQSQSVDSNLKLAIKKANTMGGRQSLCREFHTHPPPPRRSVSSDPPCFLELAKLLFIGCLSLSPECKDMISWPSSFLYSQLLEQDLIHHFMANMGVLK